MSRRFLCSLLAVLISAPALAESLPPVESFFRDPEVPLVALSPDGHHVAILTNMPDGQQALGVRDTTDLKKLTVPAGATTTNRIVKVHWINNKRIGFTVKNLKIEFEGNWEEFAVDIDGGDLKHLVSGSWHHHQDNTGSLIKDKVLTADYGFYDVTHDGSDDIIVEKYSFNQIDRFADHTRLYRLDTRTRQLTDILGGGVQPDHSQEWLTDGSDAPRIVVAKNRGRCILSYRAPDAATWTEVSNADCYHDYRVAPRFFDGADTLYVSAPYQGYSALFRYNLKTLKREKEPFVSIPGFDFRGWPEIDQSTKKLLGVHLDADAVTTVWLDPRMKALQKKIDALLPNTGNTLHCAADCPNAPVLLVSSASDRQPMQYALYTLASGTLIGIGASHPAIRTAQMGLRDFYHYAARDGRSIPVYVTQPAGKPAGPQPTVVLVHGGPTVRGGSWEWEDQAQFLASRGYLVIEPEYRGSAGFGYDHLKAGWHQWGQAMQNDLADAAKWAQQKGWSDPARVAIMGASYGGYATLMGLIKNPEVFRCGVEWAGVTDLGLMFTTYESDATQDSLAYDMRTLIGDPDKDAAMFRANSPLQNAERVTQPLLIAHGAQDARVPMVQASRFHDAVTRQNSHVEWIVYNDEGHGWRHQEDNIDFWKHVEAFLDTNLKTPH